MKLGLFLVALGLAGAAAQTRPPEPFGSLATLAGDWQGTGEGQAGRGKSERKIEFVLGGKFLQIHNRSVYPPQEKNPKGEIHEDLGLIGYDKARQRLVYRQFHSEGFVNQYVLEGDSNGKTLVFTSEAIENIKPGWRARETYHFDSPERFREVFELAEPGKDFQVYSEQVYRRVAPSRDGK